MKKWIRRILLALSLVLFVAAVLSVWGIRQFKAAPEWYRTAKSAPRQEPAEREKLARSAENKLIDAQNWAAKLRADAQRAERGRLPAATRPAATISADGHVIAVSQQELNALFDKWSAVYGWGGKVSQYVEDPQLVLHDGHLILAGKVVDLGAVVAFQFAPSIDASGQLHLDLVKVTGGLLTLPTSVWGGYREKLSQSILKRMPQWSQQAKIDSTGAANSAAMAATMGRLFLSVAQQQPAEPILFLPLVDRGQSVPVRLTDVSIEEGTLTLLVEPLTPTERAALLARIKSPVNTAQARGQ